MDEIDFDNISNLARIRVIQEITCILVASEVLPKKEIAKIGRWTHRMVKKHCEAIRESVEFKYPLDSSQT